jgi:hypothetical protein
LLNLDFAMPDVSISALSGALPKLAVNTDAYRRRFAPWWSPVTLVRLALLAPRTKNRGESNAFARDAV